MIETVFILLMSIVTIYVLSTYLAVECVFCKYFKKPEEIKFYPLTTTTTKRKKTMPMKKGSSKKVLSENIKEGMDSYKQKGTFGNSKPKNAKAAQKQIIAAAYSNAKKSKTKKK